uniref:Muscle myosin heavy chain n=1 Tax=Macrostomum lignano TaxID=282301 RepID=A0A1I8HXM7_9PLAT
TRLAAIESKMQRFNNNNSSGNSCLNSNGGKLSQQRRANPEFLGSPQSSVATDYNFDNEAEEEEEEEGDEPADRMLYMQQDLRSTRAEAGTIAPTRDRVYEAGEANRRECDLRAELARVRADAESSAAGASGAECELARLRAELADRERERRLREQEINEIKAAHSKQLDSLQEELATARSAIQQRAAEQATREKDLADKIRHLGDVLDSRNAELDSVKQEMQQCNSDKSDLESRHKAALAESAELRQSLSSAEHTGTEQANECLCLADRCRELALAIGEADRRIQSLTAELAAEREARSADRLRAEASQLGLDECQAKLESVIAERADAEARLAELESLLREERQGSRCYREQFERLETEASGQRSCLEEEVRTREKQRARLESKLAEAETALSRLQTEAESQSERLQDLDKSFKAFIRQVQTACDKHLEASQKSGPTLRAPKMVLDQLNKLLKSQRDRQQQLEQDLAGLRAEAGKHNSTVKQLRETAWQKDKSLQAARESDTANAAEAKRLRDKLSEVERRQASVRGLYTDAKRQLETEKEQRQALQQDLDRIVRLRRKEESDRLTFLKALYLQLGGKLDECSKRLTAGQVQHWLTEAVAALLKEAEGWRGLLALVPLSRRWRSLQRQKRCLMSLLAVSEARAAKLRMLADTLDGQDSQTGQQQLHQRWRRLYRFRSAVLAVIAARRLRRLISVCHQSRDSRISSTLWLGESALTTTSSDFDAEQQSNNARLTAWLSSDRLASAARAAHAELSRKSQHRLDLRVAARQAAGHLIDQLDAMFPPASAAVLLSDGEPSRFLGTGVGGGGIAERLHRGALALCRRLSMAESERDRAVAELAQAEAEAERLRRETAPLEEHRALAAQLASSRDRERCQGRQLAALTARVQSLAGEDADRDRTLAEALSAVRESRDRVEATDGRERMLTERAAALESALAASGQRLAEANRDQEAVAAYADAICRLADRLVADGAIDTGVGGSGDGGPQAASDLLQSRQLLPPASAGGGTVLARCQRAVAGVCALLAGAERRTAEAQESLLAHRKMLVQLRRTAASATTATASGTAKSGSAASRRKHRV